MRIPGTVSTGARVFISYRILNDISATAPASGTATLVGSDGSTYTASFNNLEPGGSKRVTVIWNAPDFPALVNWTLTATVDSVVVDTLTATMQVR